MFASVVYALLLTTTIEVVQGRYTFANEIRRWVAHEKVIATWDHAKSQCERYGGILASPIDAELLNYMQSFIDVNNHTVAYFIGIRAKPASDDEDVVFESEEGISLTELPESVLNRIDQLDIRKGECLAMDRRSIHTVPCWTRLPFMCYSNITTQELPPTTTQPPTTTTTQAPTTTSTAAPTTTTTAAPTSSTTQQPTTSTVSIKLENATTDCGPEYTYIRNGSCYKLHQDEQTWDGANLICTDEGAYLAIINDKEEAEFIHNMDKTNAFWVGLRCDRRRGVNHWRSVHGDPVKDIFNEWGYMSSETYSDYHLCALIGPEGKLQNYNCLSYPYQYVCEKNISNAGN